MNLFGLPNTEDLRRNARIQKYGGGQLPVKNNNLQLKEGAPKEVQHLIAPKKAVIVATITSAVTGAAGCALNQKLNGQKFSYGLTFLVGFGAGVLGGIASLVSMHYLQE